MSGTFRRNRNFAVFSRVHYEQYMIANVKGSRGFGVLAWKIENSMCMPDTATPENSLRPTLERSK